MSNKINMFKMTDLDVKQKRNALETMLVPMDVPKMRRDIKSQANIQWLMRNLGINNGQHPLFKPAMNLVKWLMQWHARKIDVGGKDFPSGF